MHKTAQTILLAIFLALVCTTTPLAQSDSELTLTISRDFGYSSGTGRIQGRFSMRVSGPDDLTRVVFLIDRQSIGEDSVAPFSLQFHTGDYALGVHSMSAVGYTQDGRELHSNEYRQEFVDADVGWQAAMKIALPILGVSFAAMLLPILLPIITRRGKKAHLPAGSPRAYGLLGGAICPKCGRPYGVHIWGINLLVGKLDRCPYCGRWSIVQRASMEALKAAEAAELEAVAENSDNAFAPPAEEKLQKDLEDSRYTDL